MRDPSLLNSVYSTPNEKEVVIIPHLPKYEIEDYDLFNEKDFRKYIMDVKKDCRGSFEYSQMVQFLRENLDMNKCSFYENVNNIDSNKIKIHIHHDPFGLEDICLIVYNKRSYFGESLEVEQVSKEVLFLHYKLMVGLIPLAETPHELVHNQYLFVPADAVLGNYKEFINLYEQFMEPEQLYVLDAILEMTKTYKHETVNVLNKQYIYIDHTGSYKLPELSVVKDMMYKKMNSLEDSSHVDNYDNNQRVPISFNK